MIEQGRIRICLLDPDAAVTRAVSQVLASDAGAELVAVAADARDLLDAIGQRAVDAIVVDLGAHEDPALLVRTILDRRPGTLVVVTGRASAATIGRVIAGGASTYLPKPYRPEELVTTVRELRGLALRHAGGRAGRGAVIAVYSPKGGVGGTTVATSLAVALAGRAKSRVAMVDLDLQFGDVGVVLDLKSTTGIAELLNHQGPLDESTVADIFARHASGVQALLAPEDPPDVGSVDVEAVVKMLDRMRSIFDYVVCDLWSSLEELALATLRAADRVVLVTTPEVPSLRHVRRVISATAPLLSAERTIVVANRAPSKSGLPLEEIERALGMPVGVAIPSDGAGITRAINEGTSIMDPRSGVRAAQAVRHLADLLAADLSHQRAPAVAPVAQAVPS